MLTWRLGCAFLLLLRPAKAVWTGGRAEPVTLADAYSHALLKHAATAGDWTAESLPNPTTDPQACGMSSPVRACDPQNYFGGDRKQVLRALNTLDAGPEYPGCGTFEMGVAVVDRVAGTTERFARGVMDSWGVGKRACNNGIVLALAIEDRSMYLATGKGAREYLSDDDGERIISRMKGLLRKDRVADAVEQCVSDVLRVLNGNTEFLKSECERSVVCNMVSQFIGLCFDIFIYGFLAVACFICCFVACTIFYECWESSTKARKYKKVKRVIAEMQKQAAEAKADRYHVESCAICLETFADTPAMPQRLLGCGHTFHAECIDGWTKVKASCAICREPDVDSAQNKKYRYHSTLGSFSAVSTPIFANKY